MQLCVCEWLCVCVSLPDFYLLVLSFILELLYLWTLFSQTVTLSLSHLLPGFAAPFSLTSRSVSTFKRVFIRLYSAKIEILQKIAHQITWLQNKRSEIWLSLCRRMGWIGCMFSRKEFISNRCKSMLLCTGKKGGKLTKEIFKGRKLQE